MLKWNLKFLVILDIFLLHVLLQLVLDDQGVYLLQESLFKVFKSLKSKELQACHGLSCYHQVNGISGKPELH